MLDSHIRGCNSPLRQELSPTFGFGVSYPSFQNPETHLLKYKNLWVGLVGEIFDQKGPNPTPCRLIADLYETGQAERIRELNGSFSVAIVDMDNKKLVVAADQLGTLPFYYWSQDGHFSGATSLAPLMEDIRIPKRLSRQGIAELLSFGKVFGRHTLYADVKALSGGELLTFEFGKKPILSKGRLSWLKRDFNETEGAERLAVALRNAGKRQTAEALNYGLLLSGGLDARAVLGATATPEKTISNITMASYENNEVAVARQLAQTKNQPFAYIENPATELSKNFDRSVIDSDGLYAAPMNLYGHFSTLAKKFDVVFSGHGLDYTIRGMYLPKAQLRVVGSRTVMPWLQKVANGSAQTVAEEQYVAIDPTSLEMALADDFKAEIPERRIAALAHAFERCDIENPYDAWDAYILHHQARHYAYSDFIALNRFVRHRCLAFDAEVFDVYRRMPPEWRASGNMARMALNQLAPDLMAVENANTGYPAHIPFWLQTALVLGRAAGRRLGVFKRSAQPDAVSTSGSWVSYPELFRRDPLLRRKLAGLAEDSLVMETGLFKQDALTQIVEDHFAYKGAHTKFLHQVLSLESWLRNIGFSGIADAD